YAYLSSPRRKHGQNARCGYSRRSARRRRRWHWDAGNTTFRSLPQEGMIVPSQRCQRGIPDRGDGGYGASILLQPVSASRENFLVTTGVEVRRAPSDLYSLIVNGNGSISPLPAVPRGPRYIRQVDRQE